MFKIGDEVVYQDEVHVITDVDEGYNYLALGGDRYITPGHELNRCISAPMSECRLYKAVRDRREK